MKYKSLICMYLFVLFLSSCAEKELATFEIEIPASAQNLAFPISMNLDENISFSQTEMSLFEINEGKKNAISFQLNSNNPRSIVWIYKPQNNIPEKRTFKLYKEKSTFSNLVKATKNDESLTIHQGDQHFLKYQFKTLYPPLGVDTVYKRSGFIHPLWSPHGQVLTRIQPEDHYHHYGIWNPWTHVKFERDTIDFWNLAKHQGTVRFAGFESITEGNVFSEFEALHEHVVLKKEGLEKIALNENHKVRLYPISENQDYFIVDFTFDLSCAGESPFEILEYRYGGFGWRTTEQWNNQNSEVITSTGKTRKNVDGSKERWCIIQGDLDNDYGGIVMMSHPSNYNHPEPMRIWPEDQYERGDMFANYAPTKDKDWLLEPGKHYILRYRLLVFNGSFEVPKAEAVWQQFAR